MKNSLEDFQIENNQESGMGRNRICQLIFVDSRLLKYIFMRLYFLLRSIPLSSKSSPEVHHYSAARFFARH